MLFSTILPLILLPLAFAAPAHPATRTEMKKDTLSRQQLLAREWYDHPNDRRASRTRRSQPSGQPSAPAPSTSGRSRRSTAKRAIAPIDLPLGTRDDLARCPKDQMACPVSVVSSAFVDSASTEWECITPDEDLYSCGGCATMSTGVDCSAIPSVLSVSCNRGSCDVHSCRAGTVPSPDGRSCIPSTAFIQQ